LLYRAQYSSLLLFTYGCCCGGGQWGCLTM